MTTKRMSDELSQDLLHELFEYRDGELIWRVRRGNVAVGAVAGTVGTHGYSQIGINRVLYLTHRLIFLMHNGYLPKYVDHIDGDKLNNRGDNLREATHSQNLCNTGARSDNTSGYKGVTFIKNMGKWRAQVMKNGKYHYGGYHDTAEEANEAATALREKLHGDFVRHE